MTELRGTSCLLTGANGGIGREVAARLAACGSRLALTGRDEDALRRLAARTGGTAIAADLTVRAELDRLVSRAGPVDVLVLNAGAGWAGDFAAIEAGDVERLVALNLTAPIQLAGALVPAMRAAGRGHVVVVSSIAGATPVAREAVYSATKAGLSAYAESLRYEVAGDGVRVSVVVPGVIDTEFFTRRGAPYDRSFPRPIRPGRVGAAVVKAIRADRDEVVVPGWMRMPVRLHGTAPRLFRRMAGRFG